MHVYHTRAQSWTDEALSRNALHEDRSSSCSSEKLLHGEMPSTLYREATPILEPTLVPNQQRPKMTFSFQMRTRFLGILLEFRDQVRTISVQAAAISSPKQPRFLPFLNDYDSYRRMKGGKETPPSHRRDFC